MTIIYHHVNIYIVFLILLELYTYIYIGGIKS